MGPATTTIVDSELDPALEEEFYEEPPELKERLYIEESLEGMPTTAPSLS